MELSAFAKTNTAARLRAAASRGALSHALILSGAGDRNAAAHYAAAALECTGTDKPCLACAHCRKVLQQKGVGAKAVGVINSDLNGVGQIFPLHGSRFLLCG